MSLKKALSAASPLSLRIVAECPVTKARACDLILPHAAVSTPVFMPVGTQGTLKGITVDQLEGLGCQICLGNTYHLGMRPVKYLLLLLTLFHCGLCCVKIKEETRYSLSTGTGSDRKSQWFAWVHELEEKSFDCECTLITITTDSTVILLCVWVYRFVYRLIKTCSLILSPNICRTVEGFRWYPLLNCLKSLKMG